MKVKKGNGFLGVMWALMVLIAICVLGAFIFYSNIDKEGCNVPGGDIMGDYLGEYCTGNVFYVPECVGYSLVDVCHEKQVIPSDLGVFLDGVQNNSFSWIVLTMDGIGNLSSGVYGYIQDNFNPMLAGAFPGYPVVTEFVVLSNDPGMQSYYNFYDLFHKSFALNV